MKSKLTFFGLKRHAQNKSLSNAFLLQVKVLKLPLPVQEYKFHPVRKWRFDFAWIEQKIAVEIEGGIWTQGAHTRGAHFESDCRKYNEATRLGWRVFRFSSSMIKSGESMETLRLLPF